MPKPPVCECEADAIILSAWIIISLSILIFLMVLTLFMYYSRKPIEFVPMLIIFLFSIIIGIGSISIQLPLTPYFQIFFMLFQTIFFVLVALDYYNNKKGW
ncbi:hypothetical protein 15570_00024 [Lokiarchaeota virus WyrdV1]|nr:hypothetical protein 15570_00024 [Lokiarchaeota virus WyrdV1]